MIRTFLAATALLAGAAQANDFAPALQSYLDAEIVSWVNDPILIDAVRAQNAKTARLSQADIDALDATWRAEVGLADSATLRAVLDNPAAEFLRQRVAAASGVITEIFVMDARGLNVAASAATSDYWQGDEEKFTQSFGRGPGAVHFGEVEFDESSQLFQSQISLSIVDPATREIVGAVTVGVNAEAL